MSKVHNKAELADKFKKGHTGKAQSRTGWYGSGLAQSRPQDPLEFANSNVLSKMKRKR